MRTMATKIHTGSLRLNELEAVYSISRVVAETIDIDHALDEIVKLSRQVFIFDNAVVYHTMGDESLEPIFARAIGRGSSAGADITWGDVAAKEVLETGKNFIYHAKTNPNTDRLDQHFFLGLPMLVGGKVVGALVFIRFGGPVYSENQINLAEFIATHVTQLFERQRLVERIANLEAERRLAQLQEDFIANVSHELNTPLGFIKGYTTTLLRKDTTWDPETFSEFLTIIDEEADRLSDLIENLLDSSRLQSGTLKMDIKPVDIDDLLSNSIERLKTRYQNLNLKVDPSGTPMLARVDSRRLGQVFDNLVSNAAKYAANSTVVFSAIPEGNKVHIMIADDGPGIPDQHLEHIFDRFYRVPERAAGVRGTGLGLFICEQIVRQHNGQIKVESKLGKGTTFHIYLPVLIEAKSEVKK